MRYTTILHRGRTAAARIQGDRLIVLDAADAVQAMTNPTPAGDRRTQPC